jgi:hypothetical protein
MACNKALRTAQDLCIMVYKCPLVMAIDPRNLEINIFHSKSMVSILSNSNFQMLCSFITIFDST